MFFFEDYLNKICDFSKEFENDSQNMLKYKEKVLKEFEKYLVDSEEYYDKLNEFYEYIKEKSEVFLKLINSVISIRETYGEDRLVNREYYKKRNRLFRQIFINEPNQNIFDNFNIALKKDLEELEKRDKDIFFSYIKTRAYFQDIVEKTKQSADIDLQGRYKIIYQLIQKISSYEFQEKIEPLQLEKFSLFSKFFLKTKRERIKKQNEKKEKIHWKEKKRMEQRKQTIEGNRVILIKKFKEVLEQLNEIREKLKSIKTVKGLSEIKRKVDSISPLKIGGFCERYLKEFILTEAFKAEIISMYKERIKNEPDNNEIKNILRINSLLNENKKIVEPIKEDTKPDIQTLQTETEKDPLFLEAVKLVADEGQASTAFLQRRLGIGYIRAAKLIDSMKAIAKHEKF